MLRFAIKFPYLGIGLNRIQTHGTSRLYIASRYYQSKGKEGGGGGGGPTFLYLVGTVTLATGATVAYAKYDPEFRQWLGDAVPYSDDLIRAVLQEQNSYSEQVFSLFNSVKSMVWSLFFSKPHKDPPAKIVTPTDELCADLKEKKDYKPPRPLFSQLLNQPPDPTSQRCAEKEKPWAEIRVFPEKQDSPIIVEGEKEKKVDESDPANLPEEHPRNLADLELKIATAATLAINSYNQAACALRDHSQDIYMVVESSFQTLDQNIWAKLKVKSDKKEELVKAAESAAKEAVESIKRMQKILEQGPIDAPVDLVESSKRNIQCVMEDVDKAFADLEKERRRASVTDKYWEKVEEARNHWTEEMEILFPGVNLSERELKVSPADLDLFILYAFQNVLFYQKELQKLETYGECRIKAALAVQGEGADKELIAAQVQAELDAERRDLELEYNKKCLAMRCESERDLRLHMRRQAEAHADHLKDAVAAKEKEVDRRYKRVADEVIATEQARYKSQLAAMLGRLRGMDSALKARADADKNAHQSQVLWSACQALYSTLKNSNPGLPWAEQLRPLAPEICAVKHAASKEDELVAAVVRGIPKEAFDRGVFPEDALRERFLKVERIARQVALVPEGGGNIPLFLLSYLQSFLLIRAVSPIPQAELADQPVDFADLDTYDILQRARYWLDRGDFSMTLRYMNLLKGASRKVACDWMNETRILLETQQAANTLMAHASASGLLYL